MKRAELFNHCLGVSRQKYLGESHQSCRRTACQNIGDKTVNTEKGKRWNNYNNQRLPYSSSTKFDLGGRNK